MRDPKAKMVVILFVLLILGALFGTIISQVSLGYIERRARQKFGLDITKQIWNVFASMYTLGTIIICMNLMLLLGLLSIYIQSYRKTRSSFLLGLVMFLGVLVVQSLLSLPILHVSFGAILYQSNILTVLPNMFETIALIILFYLSTE